MKKFVICLLAFLICGCRRTIDFDFDTYKQSLHISNGYFYDLCFENDSVLPNGKSYESALFLIWQDSLWLSGKVLGMFFLFHSILYLCIMNMLEQLARIVLPKEILDNFDIVKIETDESDIDSMSMTIYLDERMNAYLQKSEDYESKGFMDAVRITDFVQACS